jgi:hypothetical protein
LLPDGAKVGEGVEWTGKPPKLVSDKSYTAGIALLSEPRGEQALLQAEPQAQSLRVP